MGELLSDGYNDDRRQLITAKASMELRPGAILYLHGLSLTVTERRARGCSKATPREPASRPSRVWA